MTLVLVLTFALAFTGVLERSEVSFNASQSQTLKCFAKLAQIVCLNVVERSWGRMTMIALCSQLRSVKAMFGAKVAPLSAH